MASWTELTAAAPDLAPVVRARFEAHGLALLATLRADGSPRLSGIETTFDLDQLWLGSMPGSRKSADLLRDPRMALHAATVDKDVAEGDAKVSGLAVPVDDEATMAQLVAAWGEAGQPPPPGSFDLFRVNVVEVVFLRPATDHLVIESWREGGPVQRVERR